MYEETGRHINYLDGWRGMAIVAVLVGHFFLAETFPTLGTLGVFLFFGLSGRLMGEILFVRRADIKIFIYRRFTRIFPALFAFVILSYSLFWLTEYSFKLKGALLALTFTLNYAMVYAHPIALLDHLWSLCIEEHGYFMLALIAIVGRYYRFRSYLIAGVLGVFALANAFTLLYFFHQPFLEVIWRTDAGVAPLFISAAMYVYTREKGIITWSWLAGICLVLAILIVKLSGFNALSFLMLALLIPISICFIDYSPKILLAALENKILCYIGKVSFSLYLWQQPFFKLVSDGKISAITGLAISLSLGLLSYYGVEKTSRAYLNRMPTKVLTPRTVTVEI